MSVQPRSCSGSIISGFGVAFCDVMPLWRDPGPVLGDHVFNAGGHTALFRPVNLGGDIEDQQSAVGGQPVVVH